MPWIIDEGKFNVNISLIDSNIFGESKSTCIYLIKGTKKTALIDATEPQGAEILIKKFQAMNILPDILILTHSHWDHAAGTPIFQEKYPDIEVMVGKSGIGALKNPKKYNELYIKDLPFLTEWLEPIKGLTPLKEGDTIDLGDLELSIIETPGHSNCSISIFEPNQKVLFVGDSLGNLWTTKLIMPLIMAPEFSEENFLNTIDKVKTINYSVLAFPHFGFLTNSLAKNHPDKLKSSYVNWRDFFITKWNNNPSKSYVVKKFIEKLNYMGLYDKGTVITFEMFGGWMIEGLKSGNLI